MSVDSHSIPSAHGRKVMHHKHCDAFAAIHAALERCAARRPGTSPVMAMEMGEGPFFCPEATGEDIETTGVRSGVEAEGSVTFDEGNGEDEGEQEARAIPSTLSPWLVVL